MRQQHYRFAHQVLMEAVLRDPNAWLAEAEARGGAVLQGPWEAAGQGLAGPDLVEGPGPSLAVVAPAPGVTAAVVTLPPPQAPTECHFVAVVRAGGAPPRYFVAERGIEGEGGASRAYWAEWKQAPTGGVMRVRGADLPAITPEALVAAALEECRGAPPAAGPGGPGMGAPGAFGPGAGPFTPAPGTGPFAPGGGAWAGPPGAMGPAGFRPLPPPKKSRVGLFVGGGCLLVFLFFAIVGGFLLYQEEGRGIHVPDSEVASVPVTPGVPFTVEFTWDGGGYAFNNVWLVIEEGKKSGGDFKVRTKLACSRGDRANEQVRTLVGYGAHDVESKGGDAFSAWIYLGDKYAHGSSYKHSCTGTVEPVTGTWTRAHIAVTQRQRPSDFIAR